MKYWVETLGCPKNEVDSAKLVGTLTADGYAPAASADDADVVVVNTCAFIEAARQESIDTVLALTTAKKDGARVVVTGCMAERYGSELADALPEVDLVAGFGVPVTLGRKPDGDAVPSFDLLNLPRPKSDAPWAYVKVAEGCDRNCGFCAIPSFRGKQRSRSVESILDEVDALEAQEIVLVAQDLASYGNDIDQRRAIIGLVRELTQRVARVRLLYLYPSDLSDELIDTIGATGVPYFDLSLQHASAPLLRRMRRWGNGDKFLARIADIRMRFPDAALRSSFIVGYPGETEADHDELLSFVRDAQLDWAGLFSFSPEEGTHAMTQDGHVAPSLIAERLAEVSELQDTITRMRRAALVGETMTVLVDTPGRARSHREAPEIDGVVRVPDHLTPGKFHEVVVTGAHGVDLEAAPVADQIVAKDLNDKIASGFGPSALLTPANGVTLARLAVSPILLVMIVSGGDSWPAVLFWILLCATDGVDGFIARRQGTTSSGAFLDPLADKVLVLGGMLALVARGVLWGLPVGIIVGREVMVSVYRSAIARRGVSVPARWWAKVKTVVSEVAVGFALLPPTADQRWLFNGLLWVAVVLTVVTGAQYFLDAGRRARAG